MDLQLLIFLFPAGVVLFFRELRDEHVFVIIYAFVASYFASVMVRLMLPLTPVVCVSAAIALSHLLDTYMEPSEDAAEEPETNGSSSEPSATPVPTPKKGKKGAAPREIRGRPDKT